MSLLLALTGSAGSITGTLAATEAQDLASITGTVSTGASITGVLDATEAQDAASFEGTNTPFYVRLVGGSEASKRKRKDWRKDSREHLREQIENALERPILSEQEIQAIRESVVDPKPVSAGWDDDEEALLLLV